MTTTLKAKDDLTIKEARDAMRPKLMEGMKCLCCGQHTQMYKRTLTSSMAYGLIEVYKAHKGIMSAAPYIHMESYFKALSGVPASIRGDLPKLRFWGFIEPRSAFMDDGNPNDGYYKITEFGKLFVEGKLLAPKYVKIYNNQLYGNHDDVEEINIVQALKNKFDYHKLIHGTSILP